MEMHEAQLKANTSDSRNSLLSIKTNGLLLNIFQLPPSPKVFVLIKAKHKKNKHKTFDTCLAFVSKVYVTFSITY